MMLIALACSEIGGPCARERLSKREMPSDVTGRAARLRPLGIRNRVRQIWRNSGQSGVLFDAGDALQHGYSLTRQRRLLACAEECVVQSVAGRDCKKRSQQTNSG